MPSFRSTLLAGLCIAVAPPARADEAQAAVPPAAEASLAVTVDTVRDEKLATAIPGTGIVEAWQEVAVGAEAGGLVLTDVLVSEGERVEKGQLLARLDDALLQAQIAQQDALVRSAQAGANSAKAASTRAEKLTKTGAITAETADDRATAVETATAALDGAKAVRETLAIQLGRTEVRAPFAGIVSAEPAVAGGVVQAGTEIARIQRDGALEAKIKVPEQQIGFILLGDPVTLQTPAGSQIEAQVSSLGQTVDAATHLATVSVRLPDNSGFRAGMFVRGTIRSGESSRLTVAENALTWTEGQTTVFAVAQDGTVSRRTVEAGARLNGRVAVSGDIRPGEAVVAEGAGFLHEGNRVRVVSGN